MQFMQRFIALILFGILSFPLAAAQRTIGVNFTGGSNLPGGGPAALGEDDSAGVIAQTNWNNASDAKGSLTALADNAGKATTAFITWSANNTWALNGKGTGANDK